jgi:signal transduction histidine kinase
MSTLMKKALDRSRDARPGRGLRWWSSAVVASVVLISLLHYVTSSTSIELHEIFQRLYYLPIVFAAVMYGAKGGLATAALSAILFLPHVALGWHAWPIFQLGQYAEVFVFLLVGGVTGLLADRLRRERDQCQQTAVELDEACRRLEAGIQERLRTDRLVTIGRLASGIAHEIRNPLGGLLGSLEILGADVPRGHPKAEFLGIAKNQIERLNRVVTEFLDFAQPPPPATRPADIGTIVDAAVRLAAPALTWRGATVNVDTSTSMPQVEVDADQVERALLNILLDKAVVPRHACIRLGVDHPDRVARIVVASPAAASSPNGSVADVFEPFSGPDPTAGLALATARRLIENQRGTIRAEGGSDSLRYVIELPLAQGGARTAASHEEVPLEELF